MRRHVLAGLTALVTVVPHGGRLSAQDLIEDGDDRAPRFLLASAVRSVAPARVDVDRTPMLRRRISVSLLDVRLEEALRTIAVQSGLDLAYSSTAAPLDRIVRLDARDITVAAALTEVLLDAHVDVVFSRRGRAMLVKRDENPLQQAGAIVGRVTAAGTGQALVGATVTVQGTPRSATADTDGRYRFDSVPAGTYTVRARYIGYAPAAASATVVPEQEVTVDLALERSVQALEELVTVTPGGLQTEAKALPSPVTVITADDIAAQGAQGVNINEVFRQLVPSGVALSILNTPSSTTLSARGASSISGGSAMKVFIDGVEVSDRGLTPVDPTSIERIEVVRGPQASTLYGPDAAGGVLQISTKRGTASGQPQVDVSALAGVAQTPYSSRKSVLRQEYHGTVRGGTSNAGYSLGASFVHLGNWVPVDAPTAQSLPSAFATLHYAQGIVDAALSGRYLRSIMPNENAPELAAIGGVPFSRPQFQERTSVSQTYGVRLGVAPSRAWRSQLTIGYDQRDLGSRQTQPRLTTAADTLFGLTDNQGSKVSLQLNSAVDGSLSESATGRLMGGIDYYRADNRLYNVQGALNSSGTIRTTASSFINIANSPITNTGAFAQGELGWRETLFLTAGLRADDNSTFGDALDTQLQPRVGVSGVGELGGITTKLRLAFGRAIRAAGFGQAVSANTGFSIQLANPELRPERQRGWDAGVEFYFGSRGSLSVTGYTQVAEDLIVLATVAASPTVTTQYRNLGRVANRGVEVEGTLNLHPVRLRAQYAYTHSRIDDLGPGEVPGFVVGGRPNQVPVHTAGATLTSDPWQGGSVIAGVSYVGSTRGVDLPALLGCFAGTLPCPDPPTITNFVTSFDGFARLNLSVTQRLTRQLDALLTINNLTNNLAAGGFTAFPVMGRITQVGLHARF